MKLEFVKVVFVTFELYIYTKLRHWWNWKTLLYSLLFVCELQKFQRKKMVTMTWSEFDRFITKVFHFDEFDIYLISKKFSSKKVKEEKEIRSLYILSSNFESTFDLFLSLYYHLFLINHRCRMSQESVVSSCVYRYVCQINIKRNWTICFKIYIKRKIFILSCIWTVLLLVEKFKS